MSSMKGKAQTACYVPVIHNKIQRWLVCSLPLSSHSDEGVGGAQ